MDETTAVEKVMTRSVVATRPDARVAEAARLLREHHISGLPVVDGDGRVVGVLTETDLVRDLHAATGVDSPRGLLDLVLESTPRRGESLLTLCRNRLRKARVEELMTTPPVTVDRSATLRDTARRLRLSGTNRVPVVDAQGRLVGIVTRSDLLTAIEGARRKSRGMLHPPPSEMGASRRQSDPYSDA
jgi:CBS domain-containing protein